VLKNCFDLASRYAREPLQKIVDGRTVLDIVKQGAHRYTTSLENPSAANAAWVLLNTSTVGPLNHHAVMLPPCCGKLNRDFIFTRTTQVTGPVRRVRAPYGVRCTCWFDDPFSCSGSEITCIRLACRVAAHRSLICRSDTCLSWRGMYLSIICFATAVSPSLMRKWMFFSAPTHVVRQWTCHAKAVEAPMTTPTSKARMIPVDGLRICHSFVERFH